MSKVDIKALREENLEVLRDIDEMISRYLARRINAENEKYREQIRQLEDVFQTHENNEKTELERINIKPQLSRIATKNESAYDVIMRIQSRIKSEKEKLKS